MSEKGRRRVQREMRGCKREENTKMILDRNLKRKDGGN